MPTLFQVVGGAGTGKTTRAMDIMAKVIKAGDVGLEDIGFSSFTRAARAEAAGRAAEQFGVSQKELEINGWFRTLHSVCYRVLGTGKALLTDCAADRKWLADALEEPVNGATTGDEDSDGGAELVADTTIADVALTLWQAARNQLVSLESVWSRAATIDSRIPPLEYCQSVVRRYETSKRVDGRSDFVDLLGRFAGWYFSPDGHPAKTEPEGDVPALSAWIFDEQQDTSALLDSVAQRLMSAPTVRWAYAFGDPFQSVYSWCGSDARLFMAWPYAKRDVLRQTYRCPAPIHELGESLLRDCSDYWDRGIRAAEHEGSVETSGLDASLFASIDPRESWMLLARSNYHAKRLAWQLDRLGVPWLPTRGNGRWAAPKRNAAVEALRTVSTGGVIDGKQWADLMAYLPSRCDAGELLTRGTKKQFSDPLTDHAEQYPFLPLSLLADVGATPLLIDMLRNNRWCQLIDGAESYVAAVERWGPEAVMNPQVKVGTVHSVKGAEADNVLWLTSTSEQVERARREDDDGYNEEQRVAYVAATRARRRLVVIKERTRWGQKVPA